MPNINENQNFDDDIRQALQEFRVQYPDENLIDGMIDNLRQYVPSKRKNLVINYDNLRHLIKDTTISINFISLSYWVITLLLYATGYFVTINLTGDHYKLIFVLAPLPIIFGLLEVFRGREENVVELELSCKITPQEIVVSKILVTCVYNGLLNLILSLIIYTQNPYFVFWKITLLWIVPMILTGSITLWLCSKIKSIYSILLSVSCWLSAAMILAFQGHYFEYLLKANIWFVVLFLSAGILLFVKEIMLLKSRYYFEGRTSIWN